MVGEANNLPDPKRYQKKMAGETEVDISINETKREIIEKMLKASNAGVHA